MPFPFPLLPISSSTSWSLVKRVGGERGVEIRAAPFMNQGWGGPRGSLRNQGEALSTFIPREFSLFSPFTQLGSLDPRFDPMEMSTMAILSY